MPAGGLRQRPLPPLDEQQTHEERPEYGLRAQHHRGHADHDAADRHQRAVAPTGPIKNDLDLETEAREEEDAPDHESPLQAEDAQNGLEPAIRSREARSHRERLGENVEQHEVVPENQGEGAEEEYVVVP